MSKPHIVSDHWSPHSATHWAPCGLRQYFVRFYLVEGQDWPLHDHHALAKCLRLRPKHYRMAPRSGVRVRKFLVFNKNGEVQPAWLAPPAAAAMMLARARELGREGVDDVERDFAAAFHATLSKREKAA